MQLKRGAMPQTLYSKGLSGWYLCVSACLKQARCESCSTTSMGGRAMRPACYLVLCLVLLMSCSRAAFAQETAEPAIRLGAAVKSTLLDPTTYAPALFSYDATMRDWKT